MAEGDTILRTAGRLESALGGKTLRVRALDGRARAARVERLDGRRLERVEPRGKHLLFHFDELILHSHLGMSGSWQVGQRGERWRKPASAAWVALTGESAEAVQFGGPTLRLLSIPQLRLDTTLSRLGPDVLASDFDPAALAASLRTSPERELGDALLDQRLVAGIGNIFKSEACFAARVSPWRMIGELDGGELQAVLAAANNLMRVAAAERRTPFQIYRHTGRPCLRCRTPIAARGQGDANRRTYWCPSCQPRRAEGAAGSS
jgi:endonuclease VIII